MMPGKTAEVKAFNDASGVGQDRWVNNVERVAGSAE